jgi:hypothetical protein
MTSTEFRLDVPIAHSLFEFHSGLGGGATDNRHDGKGRPMCVAWLFNGSWHPLLASVSCCLSRLQGRLQPPRKRVIRDGKVNRRIPIERRATGVCLS